MGHWRDKYKGPENICVGCGHDRLSHLDQPELKGGPPNSDRGWTTLPEGKCIFQGCDCTEFVEPDCDPQQISQFNSEKSELVKSNQKLMAIVKLMAMNGNGGEIIFLKTIPTLEQMEEIAGHYGVKLSTKRGYSDGGTSSHNEIWLHDSTSSWIPELSFWHELGHIILGRGKKTSMSTVSHEGAAWEVGLIEAAKHGRIWEYDSIEMKWARSCLASYIHGEYDDLQYNDRL